MLFSGILQSSAIQGSSHLVFASPDISREKAGFQRHSSRDFCGFSHEKLCIKALSPELIL